MSKAYDQEPVEIAVKILQVTEKAILVTEEVKDEKGKTITHWLPKSKIEEQDWEVGKVAEVTMPRWLFEKKGFSNA